MSMLNEEIPEFRKYSDDEIEARATDILTRHWNGQLPVDVDYIIESQFDIQLFPIPDMKRLTGFEAAIDPMRDQIYYDPRSQDVNSLRLNFSIAHEFGHFLLHKDVFEWLRTRRDNEYPEWVKTTREFSALFESDRIEREANSFAGRLLVPYKHLSEKLSEFKSRNPQYAQAEKMIKEEGRPMADALRNYVARDIHQAFRVSVQCVEYRLRTSGLIPNS